MLRSKAKKHVCSFEGCGKSFDSRWSLTRHVRIHTGEKPHVCTFPGCNKGFVERSALTRHLQTHSDDKPFECHLCFKRFKCKEYLDVHLRTHEDTKNFQCTFPGCGRIYSTRRGLRKHRLKAHDTLEMKSAVPAMQVESHVRERVPRAPRQKRAKALPKAKSLEKCVSDCLLGIEEAMTALGDAKSVASQPDVKVALSKMQNVKSDLKEIAKHAERLTKGAPAKQPKAGEAHLELMNALNTPFGLFAANPAPIHSSAMQQVEAVTSASDQLPFSMAMNHFGGAAGKNRNDLQVMADKLMNQSLVPDDLLEEGDDDEDDDDDDDDEDDDDEDEEEDDDEDDSEDDDDMELEDRESKRAQEERQKREEAAAAAEAWAAKLPASGSTKRKGPRIQGAAFRRVDDSIWSAKIASEELMDNSYEAAFGNDGYGAKASSKLMKVQGRDFRHEKTKKKRGTYRGGKITLASNSYKFDD